MRDEPFPTSNHENHGRVEDLFRAHRRRLLDVGYRILGSLAEAEDVSAEAYARLIAADLDQIDDPEAWLVSVTGRLCIDRLRSADQRRRAYVGPWLPEPIVEYDGASSVDPLDRITLDDSVRMALMVVLEQLSPAERTSFVLHDLFAMPYDDVGDIVGRSAGACRQLASRARRRIQADPESPRHDVTEADLHDVATRFAAACRVGTIEPLIELLDPDVVGDFDSGGAIPGAPLRALRGAEPVARVLAQSFRGEAFSFAVGRVNGDPGVLVFHEGVVGAVISFTTRNGRIDILHGIGSPEKLTSVR